jgi:excisionase family DNA binding protein
MLASEENAPWYTVAEACVYLKVSNSTLYAYMKDRRLPFFYLAGTRQRRLKKRDLDALLQPGNPDELDTEDDASE